jgi:hypothetical protein
VYRMNRSPDLPKWGVGGSRNGWQKSVRGWGSKLSRIKTDWKIQSIIRVCPRLTAYDNVIQLRGSTK